MWTARIGKEGSPLSFHLLPFQQHRLVLRQSNIDPAYLSYSPPIILTKQERKDNNNMVPTNYLTATETLALIKSGQVTAEQVIQDHKQRYEERNDEVRA